MQSPGRRAAGKMQPAARRIAKTGSRGIIKERRAAVLGAVRNGRASGGKARLFQPEVYGREVYGERTVILHMKYLIVGTGGVGGCIGGFLAAGGRDVTLIARGAHLEAIRQKGLLIHTAGHGDRLVPQVKATDSLDGTEKFDVVFVCVKGYSLESVMPLIRQAVRPGTAVIPILNSLSAGDRLARALAVGTPMGGCVYVTAFRSAPGEITQHSDIFRLVYGALPGHPAAPALLEDIRADLDASGIQSVISDDIQRDVFVKFAFTSAFAAAGCYYHTGAGGMQQQGSPCRAMYVELLHELAGLAAGLKLRLPEGFVKNNLAILDALPAGTTASLQKDVKAGKTAETDELFLDVVRRAQACGAAVPTYRKVAQSMGLLPEK